MDDITPSSKFELEKTGARGHLAENQLRSVGFPGSDGPVPSASTTRDYIKVLFRQKSIILLTIVTVTLSTIVGLQLKTPVYEAQVRMLITAEKQVDSPFYREMILSGRNVEASLTQSEIVKSKSVLERTISALGLQKRPLDYEKKFATPLKQRVIDWQVKRYHLDKFSPEELQAVIYRLTLDDLKEHIKVEPVRDTNLFTISVRDFSPIGAAIIANAVSRSYVIFDLEQQYVDLLSKYTEKNPIVLQMKDNIRKMEQGLSGQPLPNIEAIGPASVKIIEQSMPPLKPIGLPKKILLVLAFVMSIFLAVMLAFMFEYMDQTFHAKEDLENFLGVPVIACINRKKGLGDKKIVQDVTDANRSPRAVSYRILAQRIHFMMKTKGIHSLLFSPVHPKEDVSAILSNTAVFLSKRLGLRTLIIDANLRHPSLHKVFKERNDKGLAQVLEGIVKPEEVIRPVGEKMHILLAGRSLTDPAVLFDVAAIGRYLGVLKNSYDIILIESSNFRDFHDATMIGPAVDGTIVVVGESTVRRQVVQHAVKHLREHSTKVIGAVMPNREYVIPKFLYESV